MAASTDNRRDERLSALLQQWKGVVPPPGFEAAVWRRIRATETSEPYPASVLSLLHEWLLPRIVRVSAMAAVLGVIVGVWAGFSASARSGHAAVDLLHPHTVAGSYLTMVAGGLQ